MARVAIIAITKHGIEIGLRIKSSRPESEIFVPAKYRDSRENINWFSETTTGLIQKLFKTYDSLVCIFSLGAVIRLIAPLLEDKKTDPAVLVVDDQATFVISALSGHLGGANAFAKDVASTLGAIAVITTAADVNKTIAIDLLGADFGWTIENFENVTAVSALMVNEEKIAVLQMAGERNWWKGTLPNNVKIVTSIDEILAEQFKAALLITDSLISGVDGIQIPVVIYRPKSLVLGLGLHWDTDANTIETGVKQVLNHAQLAFSSIRNVASINRGTRVKGLEEYCQKHNFKLELYDKETLSAVNVPNPSEVVQKFEMTPSVAEASALLSSKGQLVVQKQKIPPNLTVSVARIPAIDSV